MNTNNTQSTIGSKIAAGAVATAKAVTGVAVTVGTSALGVAAGGLLLAKLTK